MKPMLARTVGPKYKSYPCYVQPKLNGVRALYQLGTFQSRDEKVWKPAVVEHLTNELATLGLGNLVLDGEFYKHGWRLQQINGAIAVNRSQPREDTHSVCFHVFDIVNPLAKFSTRWLEVYHGLISAQANLRHIKVVPTSLAHSWAEVEQHFYLYTRYGYEGIMLRPDGPYEYGERPVLNGDGHLTTYRSYFLWKHKHWEDDEFVCVGTTRGEGKAEIGIGALILRAPNGAEFGVGTGFTDRDRIEFSQTPPLGKMVKVRFLCLTADGVPFNPSFLAVL